MAEQGIDLRKIGVAVERLKPSEIGFVIVSSGSFAPVHQMHVAMFQKAKEAIEKWGSRERSTVRVVGGVIAPSSDGYVRGKLGKDWIPLRARIEMCELVCSESDWITSCSWGIARGAQIVQDLNELLQHTFPQKKLQAIEMHGADTILRFRAWEKAKQYIVIGRPGFTRALKKEMDRGKVHKNSQLIFAEGELEDVSSTQIREAVHTIDANWKESDPLPESLSQFLHPLVSKYMILKINPFWNSTS